MKDNYKIDEIAVLDAHLDQLQKDEKELKEAIDNSNLKLNDALDNLHFYLTEIKSLSYESGKILGKREELDKMRTEKGKTIDASKYVGDKTKVESARIEDMKHGEVIKIVSEVIEFKGDDSLPEDKTLRASKIFGLGKSEEDEKLIVIENSKLEKFLKDKKVEIKKDYEVGDSVEELIAIECIIQKNDDGFLELS